MRTQYIKSVVFVFLLLIVATPRAFALSCPALGCDDIGTLAAFDVYTHTRQVTGAPFVDIYNFSLGASAGDVTLGVTDVQLFDTFDIDGLALALFGGFDGSGSPLVDGATQYHLALGQGDYSALVSGIPIGTQGGIYTVAITAVPLPASLILLFSGMLGLAIVGRRRQSTLSFR